MSSRKSGKRWGSQSKYQPSVKSKREAVDKVLSGYKKKAKPKISISKGKVEQVTGNIGSYRSDKQLTSFVNTNSYIQRMRDKGWSDERIFEDPTIKKVIMPKAFKEFSNYVESPEIKEQLEWIKVNNPSFKAPYDSTLYLDIKLLEKAIKSNPNNESLRREYEDSIKKFLVTQVSTRQSIDNLIKYYNEQNDAIRSVYKNSDKLKSKYSEEEFTSNFWQLYRQALNKSKGAYESSSLLATMAATNSDYLFEDIGDNIVTQERIQEAYSMYIESGFGRNVPDIPQTYLVQKPKKKASKVESIKPGERIKPRLKKDSDWFDSLTSDEDRDELIGYAPEKKMRDYSKIYQMFPTKGELDEAKETMENARKSGLTVGLKFGSAIPLDDGSLMQLMKPKPSLEGYTAVFKAINENPDFNKKDPKDLFNVVIKFSELMGEEDE